LDSDTNLRVCFENQYKEVVQALRTGDIRLLRQALQTNEDQCVLFGPTALY
jgi:hypothetical protein